MKKVTESELIEILNSSKGATFSGLTYRVDESKSRKKGGKHMVQKRVELAATLRSVYKAKIDRILEKNGIVFDWTPNKGSGVSYEKEGGAILVSDKNPEKKYLAFVCETHAKPHTEYFVEGAKRERNEIWNEAFITPAALANPDKDKQAVKNSLFNHAMKMAAVKQERGEDASAELEAANKLSNCEEFQKLEFLFREVALENIESIRIGGEEYEIVR